ncbi:hypothetical protein EDB86DRAFT_2890124 [Lactarius hatsudake]|nr:hypothetical protein EDB86DRAFT_2890124 [Lactarius hatsudake]
MFPAWGRLFYVFLYPSANFSRSVDMTLTFSSCCFGSHSQSSRSFPTFRAQRPRQPVDEFTRWARSNCTGSSPSMTARVFKSFQFARISRSYTQRYPHSISHPRSDYDNTCIVLFPTRGQREVGSDSRCNETCTHARWDSTSGPHSLPIFHFHFPRLLTTDFACPTYVVFRSSLASVFPEGRGHFGCERCDSHSRTRR